jgi:ATP-dependent exoDNAse (exonuclease V) beta subunit
VNPEGAHPATAEQRRAIDVRDRDVFLQAGAGSGKTRVLVERYCDAVDADGVTVDRILAFTFTERAAAEMRQRVRRALARRAAGARERGDDVRAAELSRAARQTERAWVTTIHGFCRRLLAMHPVAAGLDPRFRVLDDGEAGRLRERVAAEAIAGLVEAGNERVADAAAAYRPRRLAEMVIAAHERLRSHGVAEPRLPPVSEPVRSRRASEDEAGELSPAELEAARAARAALDAVLEEYGRRYDEAKAARAGLDFADLELRAVDLLRSSPAIGAAWRERFDHVMVDEFQDTNTVQLELVEALRGAGTRLFVVGDENQSIYRFRNADLEVFRAERRRAESDPATESLGLRGNFRSLPQVLAAANQVGAALLPEFPALTAGRQDDSGGGVRAELLLTVEQGAKGETWKADGIELELPPSGSGPVVVAEARFLARRLRELVDAGEVARGDIVVLLRAFTHVDAYEEALQRAGLEPYVVGGRGYWSQQQVEDVIRLAAVIANPLDDEQLFGALSSPAALVSPDALWLLRRAAGDGRHVWPALSWRFGDAEREPSGVERDWLDAIEPPDAERLRRFCSILGELRAGAPMLALDELLERAMVAFGYDLALLARDGGRGRMANVRKLLRLAREFEAHEGRDLRGFLAAAELSTRRDEREGMAPVQAEDHDGVRIMTVHAAKGLEFPVVAVPDLGRRLNAGHRGGDLVVARPDEEGATRFGMRLAFPSESSVGLWELFELHEEEKVAEAEEGCRLIYVAATRARDRLILSGAGDPSATEPRDASPSDPAIARLLPALASLGWAGGSGEVALPPPDPVEGAEPSDEATLRIRLNHPDPEQAALLRERAPAPARAAEELAGGPPPLTSEFRSAPPVGHLSYSALASYERCGYRFYLERLLGLSGPGLAAPAPADDGRGAEEAAVADATREPDELVNPAEDEAAADPQARALAVGNAVHAALEWSARDGWTDPGDERLAELVARETVGAGRRVGGTGELVERAAALVRGWLGSSLCDELGDAAARPEVPFVLSLAGTVIRGNIDLLAAPDGGRPTVIDYKTDALGTASPAAVGERYAIQRAVYALAASAALGTDRVRTVHCFLERPEDPVIQEFGPDELAAARERLTGLVEEIASGRFEVTDEPSRAVCLGCPAAERLCPHPAWRPRRGRPATEPPAPEPMAEPGVAAQQLELL